MNIPLHQQPHAQPSLYNLTLPCFLKDASTVNCSLFQKKQSKAFSCHATMAEEDAPASFLLLLPPPPSPPTIPALKAAYGDTLSQVLKEVASASQESTQAAILDIALAIPHLVGQETQSRASLYHSTQSVIAAVYKLICILATSDKVNIEDSDGVDARILPIAWSPDASSTSNSPFGPVVDLTGLAASQRQWQYAFGVETDAGEAFVRAFVAAKQHASHVHRSPTAPHRSGSRSAQAGTAKKHHHVAVGGTFDHLHLGHKLLLTMTAFALDDSQGVLTIGITGDALLKNKSHSEYLQSWTSRQSAVHRFLEALLDFTTPDAAPPAIEQVNNPGPNGHAVNLRYGNALELRCVEIADPFGPTITDKGISALVVSGETRSGGKAVNDKRAENGWSELEVFEVEVLDAAGGDEAATNTENTNFQSKISSTEIRAKLAQKTAKPSM